MGLQSFKKGSYIVPISKEPSRSETFQILKYKHRPTRIRIKAPNEGHVTDDSKGEGRWRDDDPSVFEMKIGRQFDGEFQVTNGHGKLAPKVMREHWNTFITEDDFKFMSTFDPTPPAPYVGGSLKALDNAFSWARKYGMKVIIDLHAALGSQTNSVVSSSRDGFVEWGQTDQNIQETVDPCVPYVTLEKLKRYYRAGYNAVRKHSSTVYVIMASRMQYGMKPVDPTELFPLARELKGSAIDVHYYQIFMPVFKKMNHQQNIDFFFTNTSVELNRLIKPNNPQIFIGEWATEWGTANLAHPNLSKKTIEDYKKLGKAQLQVYGKATFGWAYWTLKCPFSHLSFEWMIKNVLSFNLK
ncbi:putative glucan 1,3-beta-glucosidase A [Camellia lanceoleosa]|uniref:Glucan 1,3-beta-glucosidase A n=1 Tax=Camellia lanceoleosa TaxID=1840588 RepID=A0ACC0HR25_9ERIC|nr:putative glucan 1,3-beta-glucosidase A [Camellia lanceoleosa]